jgi:hypothetical protein
MSTLGAILVQDAIARLMHTLDVIPPEIGLVRALEVAPETSLPEILQNNLLTFDGHIAGF